VILDRSSVTVFAQNGTLAMTNLIFPTGTKCRVMFFRQGGTKTASVKGTFWNLRSIWDGTAMTSVDIKEGR